MPTAPTEEDLVSILRKLGAIPLHVRMVASRLPTTAYNLSLLRNEVYKNGIESQHNLAFKLSPDTYSNISTISNPAQT